MKKRSKTSDAPRPLTVDEKRYAIWSAIFESRGMYHRAELARMHGQSEAVIGEVLDGTALNRIRLIEVPA